MKKLLIVIACCVLTSTTSAQSEITTADWQADLRFLQNTVHKDYEFLFKKTTAEQFDADVDRLYQAIPDLQEHEIVTGLARIVSSFKYGHTSLGMRGGPVKFHQLPINFYQFKDGVFVEGVHKDYEKILPKSLLEILLETNTFDEISKTNIDIGVARRIHVIPYIPFNSRSIYMKSKL